MQRVIDSGSLVSDVLFQLHVSPSLYLYYKATISFCTETGVTLFGLVEQDYQLPEDIIEEMGLETFDFDTFSVDTFEADTFKFETFDAESIEPDTLGIRMLRRGVLGISKIGYVK